MHEQSLGTEVLVLTSNTVIGEALVGTLRQYGWDADRFDPVLPIPKSVRLVVGFVDPTKPEAALLETLVHRPVVALHGPTSISGATVLEPGSSFVDLLAALSRTPRTRKRSAITVRHTQILQQVANGLTVHEAAEKLGITSKTANNHLFQIYARLDVDNLTQAVLTAIRQGFISAPGSDRVGEQPQGS